MVRSACVRLSVQRIEARNRAFSGPDFYATEAPSGSNCAPQRWRRDGEMRYTVGRQGAAARRTERNRLRVGAHTCTRS
jgi:hypothetical protein